MLSPLIIRKLLPQDRKTFAAIMSNIHQFTDEERECALELMDLHLEQGEESGYEFLVAEAENSTPLGYICYGKIPLTDACYDIYWIVINPEHQGKGGGTRLLQAMEDDIKNNNARKVFIETSSQATYSKTRKFYQKNRYELISDIKDFFKKGDSKLTYVKDLTRR